MDIGKIEPSEITQEMKRSYLDYAMSVIVSRALPDIRDGLKPVHRRILYAMHQLGLHSTGRYTKSAKVVGEVLGKYHPHGDMSVYDALVRLAQHFSMRYPLINGQGNFGSVDGDPPAAMRYTEVKLARTAEEMLGDITKETVPFVANFDNTLAEPTILPAKIPNLLLMGSDGIAVGMATKIPPHNLTEVADALILMIKESSFALEETPQGKKLNNSSDIPLPLEERKLTHLSSSLTTSVTLDEIMQFIKGPDFPTGGNIYDIKEIKNGYATGKGRILIRGKADIEDIDQGKSAIIIRELPYQVNKAQLVVRIAELAKTKRIEGISDLRDESDRHGIRVVVELKRDSKPRNVLNNLYKHTNLQTIFPLNMVALVDGTPQTLTLKTILEEYLRHRHRIVTKRSQYELKEARQKAHILEGLKIAVNNIDEVIETIKKSDNAEVAKEALMKKFSLSPVQATAILDMQLRRLAALERQKIEDEYQMVKETINYLEDLLSYPEKILAVINDELIRIKQKYGDQRQTRVFASRVGELKEEQLIPNEETLIVLTKTGYIKRLPKTSFRLQKRGGRGVIGMTTKEADEVAHLSSAQTHDFILFFTDLGKVYQVRVWDLPLGTRQSKGQAVVNVIDIAKNETVTSLLTVNKEKLKQGGYIAKMTKKGLVKKTKLIEYANIRRSGLTAIKLDPDDSLCLSSITSGSDEIFLISHQGKSIRFQEKEVRPTGRATRGVRGIALKQNDYIISASVITSEKKAAQLLTICEKGVGKKTAIRAFPRQKRGGQGVKVAKITSKTGPVVVAQLVPKECGNLVITSSRGQTVKLPIETVKTLARTTQGVILMRLKGDDQVAAATCV